MNPKAIARELMLLSRAEQNFNPANSGNNEKITGLFFHVFESDQTFGGETWTAGDILIGDIAGDNIVYRSDQWRVRTGSNTQVIMGQYGLRIVEGAFGYNQTSLTLTSGAYDLTDTGSGTLKTSYIRISASTGAFSIDSIAAPVHQNQVLYIKNESANNMTINDAATAGAAPSGYWTIDTQTAAPVATTGIGIAHFIANEALNVWELVSILG